MIQIIDISLIPSDNKSVINVSQFDNVSRVLRFNVFDDVEMEVPHVFDNTETVLLNIRKNDNNIVVITGVIVSDIDPETQEVTGQYLTFELTEQACACVGSNYGEVSITSGDDEVIGSCNFKLIVERSPLAGGLTSQTAIDNLTTQIEEITEQVIGDDYYNKEEVNGLIDDVESLIPTKTSQLTNDSGFITASDIPTIPTKTSQLTNDSGFITASDIPTIPTKTSQLTNDSGYITANDIPTIPTKTSQLTNDSGFITASDVPTKTSQLTNDSGFTTIDDSVTALDKTWSSDKISDELYDLLPVGSASGPIASFDTALAKPLVSCVVDENATLLTKCGKNLFPEANVSGTTNVRVGIFLKAGTYTFSALAISSDTDNTVCGILFQYTDDSYDYMRSIDRNTRQSFVITTPKETKFIYLYASGSYQQSQNDTFSFSDIQIEVGRSATDYEVFKKSEYDLPLTNMPETYIGNNNFFTDYGDTTVQYKDTIQHYIDTRVNAVSNRSLSMMRTLETLDQSAELERGDNNDENER